MNAWHFACLLLVTPLCLTAGPSVFEKDGRIWLRAESGVDMALTAGPRDSEPWLTLDRKTVVFCRADPADQFNTSVYSVDVGSHGLRLVFSGAITYNGQPYRYLGRPQMDPGAKTLLVIVRHSVTNGALFSIDLATGAQRYVAEAADFEVIRSGPDAHLLLLNQRMWPTERDGYRYEWWIYSRDGQRVHFVTAERVAGDVALRLAGSEAN